MIAPRVAFVITGLGVGGAERQVIDLTRALTSSGVGVLIVTLIDPSEWGVASIGETAVIAPLGMSRGWPDPRAIARLRHILDAWKPDIVHAHMIHANILARLALGRSSWPLVNTVHNVREGGRVLEFVQTCTRRIPDWTTLVSDAALQRQSQAGFIDDARSSVIYNGISLSRLSADPEPQTTMFDSGGPTRSRFTWAAIGRLEPQKDYPHLLRSAADLRAAGYEFQVRIAGSGYLQSSLERQIKRLDLGSTIRLVGHVPDVGRMLRASDGAVNSSVVEGLPLSLIEAGAHAVPVVATDVGGTSEVVKADITGILVAKEKPNGLATGMAAIMDLPIEHRRQMGTAGAEHVRATFDLNHIVNKWLELYERLAPGRRFEDIRPGLSGSSQAE